MVRKHRNNSNGSFGNTCVNLFLKPVRNIFLILMALAHINSTFIYILYIKELAPHDSSIIQNSNVYYSLLRFTTIFTLLCVILYIFALIYKNRIFSFITLIFTSIGMPMSLVINNIASIEKIENYIEQRVEYNFILNIVEVLYYIGSIAIIISLLYFNIAKSKVKIEIVEAA